MEMVRREVGGWRWMARAAVVGDSERVGIFFGIFVVYFGNSYIDFSIKCRMYVEQYYVLVTDLTE